MNTLLRAACLALYAAGLAAAAGLLPPALSVLATVAALLLAAHVVECVAMFGVLRRYPGSLAASIGLTLLFGMLHWLPLRRLPA